MSMKRAPPYKLPLTINTVFLFMQCAVEYKRKKMPKINLSALRKSS